MAPFANSLRHLWGCGQSPTPSASHSISNLDGLSDGRLCDQHMYGKAPQQLPDSSSATGNKYPPSVGQCQAVIDKSEQQVARLQQYEQPSQQLAMYQKRFGLNDMHGLGRVVQEPGNGGQGQGEDSILELPSRTATVQPPETSPQQFPSNNYLQTIDCPNTVINASEDIEVKEEPAADERNDHDMFAEFVNDDYHNGDARTNVDAQQVSNNTDSAVNQAPLKDPLIKPEPDTEDRPSIDAVERAGTVESATSSGHCTAAVRSATHEHNGASSVGGLTAVPPKSGLTTFSVDSEAAHPSALNVRVTAIQGGIPTQECLPTAITNGSQFQNAFERNAQDPRQRVVTSRAALGTEKSQRSPSADSVTGSQRHSSEEAASSLSGMDLAAGSHLFAQQWQQRQRLSGMGTLTAEAVRANPRLLHGPISTQQHDQGASQLVAGTPARQHTITHAPNMFTANHTQHVKDSRLSSKFPYSSNMQSQGYPETAQNGQLRSYWVPPGYGLHMLMQHSPLPEYPTTNTYPPHHSINPQRINEVQGREDSKASDDDEPLVAYARRHGSTTASPIASPEDLQPANPSTNVDAARTASKPDTSGVREYSVVELSDDGDDVAAEPFSWKLPDFEATYHPPTNATDLPIAKVSIPNLVREEVALTEDHAQQEMQLFLDVFLPAQQALQTRDPEPAHAVINFHTISVMVLETFVQYEIGDEMGRGYGFLGGNIANRPLRPSPSSSDAEPARTRSAQDADVDDIFFAVIDRWRAGLLSGKETLRLIRGCQEFCDIALDVIHYVKERGLLQPAPKQRKERSDKGVARGPRGGAKDVETGSKAAGKRKAEAVESKASAKKGSNPDKATMLQSRKKPKVEDKKKSKPKPKPKTEAPALVVHPRVK